MLRHAPTHVEVSPSQLLLDILHLECRKRDFEGPHTECVSLVVLWIFLDLTHRSLNALCMLPYAQVNSMSGFPLPFIPFIFTVCDSSHEEQSCCLQIKYHISKLTRVENIWWSWCMLLNVNIIWNHLFNYCILGCDDVKSKYLVIPLNSQKRERKKKGSWFNIFVVRGMRNQTLMI